MPSPMPAHPPGMLFPAPTCSRRVPHGDTESVHSIHGRHGRLQYSPHVRWEHLACATEAELLGDPAMIKGFSAV